MSLFRICSASRCLAKQGTGFGRQSVHFGRGDSRIKSLNDLLRDLGTPLGPNRRTQP